MGVDFISYTGCELLAHYDTWAATEEAAGVEYAKGRRTFAVEYKLETPELALPLVPPKAGFDLYLGIDGKVHSGANYSSWSHWYEWMERVAENCRRKIDVNPFGPLLNVSWEGILGTSACVTLAEQFTQCRPVARSVKVSRGDIYHQMYMALYSDFGAAFRRAKKGGLVRFF